jgi:predicted aldo/keto reductase-like oxidoreductase
MNEEAHIDENLRIANEAYPGSLTDKELALVDRVEETYRNLIGLTNDSIKNILSK